MKYCTMVARSGNPKGPSGALSYTLVGDDFSIHTVGGDALAQAINSKKITVTNMTVNVRGLVSTNGAMDKYTTIGPNGAVVGTPRFVILNRVETKGKLSGYVVFTNTGIVQAISVKEAAAYAAKGLVANGKIKHTADGDIVSSINGNYPLVETSIKDAKDDVANINLVFFGSAIKGTKAVQYAGVIVTSKSAKTISKMFSTLNTANINLKEELQSVFGFTPEELAGFEFKQAPGAGFYGVYPLTIVNKLMNNGKPHGGIPNIMIGCTDRNEDKPIESIVVYDTKKKTITNSQTGTKLSDHKLKTYAANIVKKMETWLDK